MVVRLKPEHPGTIQAHGEATYPNECCGLMLGRLVQGDKHILEVLPAENARKESDRHNRFLISPRTMFEAEKRAREKGMEVLGFYHSHPDAEARPSRFDLDHAWPFYSYLIVSVSGGRAGDMTCWRLADDRSRFGPEEIEAG